jgi:two-component system, OmpR family, copper resistance phosphate regulon response regulator CusR
MRSSAFERPDVCVLDLMLPGRDGWNVIESARADGIPTPIVVVSARGTEHDRVHALEIGADDYLVKPFSMNELVARVRAGRPDRDRGAAYRSARGAGIRRRRERRPDSDRIPAPLPARALQLALERGRVVTRDELLQRIWSRRESHRDRTVDVFVRRLRDKVDRRARRHTFIQIRYGVGYQLEPLTKRDEAGL